MSQELNTSAILSADGDVLWQAQPGPQQQLFDLAFAPIDPAQEILIGGARGGGKLSPVDSLVLTPKGFVRMGDTKVGMSVSDPVTGGSCRVIGVFPQGLKKIWRLTFDDGAALEVGEEHLWAYRKANHHKPRTKASPQRQYAVDVLGSSYPESRWDHYQVGKTSEMIEAFEAGHGVRIPLTEPVLFTCNSRAEQIGVDPYLIGLLLGDGNTEGINITSVDDEIRDYLLGLGFIASKGEIHLDGKAKGYRAAGPIRKRLDAWLRNHEMRHSRSWEKVVPEYVKTSSIAYRLAFLQGLMDTDGTIDERGRCYFISTSRELAEGVQWLARSLGGKARIRHRQTYFTYKGEKKAGRPSYQVRIWHPRCSALFRLSRKKARATDSWNGGAELTRELAKVEYVGEKEAQCIAVSSPYGLYIADDFLVTHNTSALIAFMAQHIDNPDFKGLILRKTNESLKEFVDTAWAFYKKLGAKRDGRPTGFTFPSGAKLYTGHFKDERSLEDYKGHEYHFIGLEEATQVSQESMYEALLGSNRSSVAGILPRILLTTNPDGPGNCIDAGEVLTPSGWKDIRDFQVGEPVFTVRPDGTMVETVVSQTLAVHYKGDLCRVNLRGFYLSCTPNHSVPKLGGTRRDPDRLFTLTRFDELPGQAQILRTVDWTGQVPPAEFELPPIVEPTGKQKSRLKQPDRVKSELFFQLMGWFLSEGHTLDRDCSFGLSQIKADGVEKITALMREIGFSGKWSTKCFTVYSRRWWDYLKQFGKAKDKFIPEWMKNADRKHLRLLFDAMVDGDGHWSIAGKSGEYYSTSKQLADDFAEVAFRLGYHVTCSNRMPSGGKGLRSYMVFFKTNGSRGVEFRTNNHVYDVETECSKPSAVEKVPFDGMVYCLGIADTHTFVVRQNGCVWVSGNTWLQRRFINVFHKGKKIEPGTRFFGEDGRVRVYIPARIYDNKILMENDPGYLRYLEGIQNDALRRAWLLGDWNCHTGLFFPEWRPTGPYPGEPENANHVIPSQSIPAWCHRWASLDWGYAHHAAGYWFANAPDKRVHVYREMVVRNMYAEDLGAEFAKRTMEDLEQLPDRSMTLYLSHDAFSARNAGKTIAEQIKTGIERIIGPGSAYLLGKTEEERKAAEFNESTAQEMFADRFKEQFKNAKIVIKRSASDRVAMASVAREYFKWNRVVERVDPDMAYARRLLEQVNGYEKYTAYLKKFEDQQELPPTPRAQIHDCCRVLIETIPQLRPDPNDLEKVKKFHGDESAIGDDPWDGFGYGLMGATEQQNALPYGEFMSREVMRHLGANETDLNLKVQVAMQAHAKFNKQNADPIIGSLPRDSMRHRWHQ